MKKGQPAPFDGQLLSTELALELGSKAKDCDREMLIELNRAAKMTNLDIDHEQRLRKIDADLAAEKELLLNRRIEELEVWYRSPVFVGIVSAVTTVGMVLVTVEVLEAR